METSESFLDKIDSARNRRTKELLDIRQSFRLLAEKDLVHVASQTVVVLAYAHWEGFYNECVGIYLEFLRMQGKKVKDYNWILLTFALEKDFQSLRDRNHSIDSRTDFLESFKSKMDCRFDIISAKSVSAQSNLNFERMQQNYTLLNFDVDKLQKMRIRLDKEIVDWRHKVAHGESPDLTSIDAVEHLIFAEGLLMVVSDHFQEAITVT